MVICNGAIKLVTEKMLIVFWFADLDLKKIIMGGIIIF